MMNNVKMQIASEFISDIISQAIGEAKSVGSNEFVSIGEALLHTMDIRIDSTQKDEILSSVHYSRQYTTAKQKLEGIATALTNTAIRDALDEVMRVLNDINNDGEIS